MPVQSFGGAHMCGVRVRARGVDTWVCIIFSKEKKKKEDWIRCALLPIVAGMG
jgi:hypothetical protein